MGVIGTAVKLVVVPIVLVVILVVLIAFAVLVIRRRKKRTKDVEQAEPLPPFINYAWPPTYTGPAGKSPVAVVQNAHPARQCE